MKYALIFLYLLVGFVPYFGTIDTIGSQWFYLSILNIISISYLVYLKSNFFNFLLKISRVKFVLFYLLFISFCVISLIFSNNISLSVVDISRVFTTFFVFVIIAFLLSEIKFYYLSVLISIVLFFEIVYSYFPLIEFLKSYNFFEIDFNTIPNSLRGVTGNKNVLASNIAFKLPFVFYVISKSKLLYKFLGFLLVFITFITLILVSSRASFISLSFIMILLLFSSFREFSIKSFLEKLFSLFLLITSIFLITLLPSNNLSVVTRINSINSADVSTNYRLQLWENATDYIYNHPFIGCGLGNWKLESLPYWKDMLSGYTIPYHAHNDFLELTAEIGLFGGLFYLLVFVLIFFIGFKRLFISRSYMPFLLLSLLAVYFIDAFFNFPIERAISQVNFALLLCVTYLVKNNE